MGNQASFKCWNCRQNSRYIHQADKGDTTFRLMDLSDRDESRTYYCEHCGKTNKLNLKESQWMIIDLNQLK